MLFGLRHSTTRVYRLLGGARSTDPSKMSASSEFTQMNTALYLCHHYVCPQGGAELPLASLRNPPRPAGRSGLQFSSVAQLCLTL